MIRLLTLYLFNNSFTAEEMVFPSALPASFFVAIPITFPMSAGVTAPTSAIILVNSVLSYSADI